MVDFRVVRVLARFGFRLASRAPLAGPLVLSGRKVAGRADRFGTSVSGRRIRSRVRYNGSSRTSPGRSSVRRFSGSSNTTGHRVPLRVARRPPLKGFRFSLASLSLRSSLARFPVRRSNRDRAPLVAPVPSFVSTVVLVRVAARGFVPGSVLGSAGSAPSPFPIQLVARGFRLVRYRPPFAGPGEKEGFKERGSGPSPLSGSGSSLPVAAGPTV